jgi:hypothetical protein
MRNEEFKKSSERLYGIYRAVVVDNDDSNEWNNRFTGGSGRVRVRIWGMHTQKTNKSQEEGIPDNELPWAEPAYPVVEGSITDIGLWSVPVKGTHVFVFFENGDHMQPRYFACASGIQPTQVKKEGDDGFVNEEWITRDRTDEPDYARVARGDTRDTFIENINNNLQSVAVGSCSPVSINEDTVSIGQYPHILDLETHGNHALALDSTPNEKRFFYYHPSKTYIEVDPNGSVIIHSVNKTISISESDRKIAVKGSNTKAIEGNESVGIDGNWTIDVGGTIWMISDDVKVGACSGHRNLAFANHTHGIISGNSSTKPCTDNTTNLKAT